LFKLDVISHFFLKIKSGKRKKIARKKHNKDLRNKSRKKNIENCIDGREDVQDIRKREYYLYFEFLFAFRGIFSSENKTILRSQNAGDSSQNGKEQRIRMYHARQARKSARVNFQEYLIKNFKENCKPAREGLSRRKKISPGEKKM